MKLTAQTCAFWIASVVISLAPRPALAVTETPPTDDVEAVATGRTALPQGGEQPTGVRARTGVELGEWPPSMSEIAGTTEVVVNDPEEALELLKTGNARFFSGHALRPEMGANQRRAQIMSQTPFAVVLGCSDSRVPIEIVYDQGLGDIFAIRVAGNIAAPSTLGSIEYAIEHLKTKIVVVMGHEGCGAVAAALLPAEKQKQEPENVQYLLSRVRPSVQGLPAIRDRKARMREAIMANVRFQVAELKKNAKISAAIESGQIMLVGAFYEISSGAVDFLETEEELRFDSPARQ